MDAIENTQRQWFERAANTLVDTRGVEAARRVIEMQRIKPIPGADYYLAMIEAAIAKKEAQ